MKVKCDGASSHAGVGTMVDEDPYPNPEDYEVLTIEEDGRFRAFLLKTHQICYRCGESTSIIGFLVSDEPPQETVEDREMYAEDIATFRKGVEELKGFPPDVASFPYISEKELPFSVDRLRSIERRFPLWHRSYSATVKDEYYMNHCEKCGAKQGDYYIHMEPDGNFFFFQSWYSEGVRDGTVDPSAWEKLR